MIDSTKLNQGFIIAGYASTPLSMTGSLVTLSGVEGCFNIFLNNIESSFFSLQMQVLTNVFKCDLYKELKINDWT
jgi:hypothetical protein